MIELIILSHEGDTALTWNPADPKACEEARHTVADLKAKGYSFFLVDGSPAADLPSGGALIVRRLTAEEVLTPPAAEPQPEPKRRGRPRKQVIATRPIAGG